MVVLEWGSILQEWKKRSVDRDKYVKKTIICLDRVLTRYHGNKFGSGQSDYTIKQLYMGHIAGLVGLV